MMDSLRLAELRFEMQHRHSDGSWSPLEPRPSHHSPAEEDPERAWSHSTVYACPTCDEQVRVKPREGG